MPSDRPSAPPIAAPEQTSAKLDGTVLLLAFFAAVIVRASVAWAAGPAAPQEIRYINIAKGLLDGTAFKWTGARFPAIIQPPFYPFLVALARPLLGNSLAAARGVSVLVGALLIFPAAGLTRRILGAAAARRAAWITATYPLLCHISGLSMTEPTFSLLVGCAAIVFYGADEEHGGAFRLLAGGGLLGLAFLTRPEGLTYLAAGSALFFLYKWRAHRRAFARSMGLALLPLAGFLLFAGPYAAWVHGKTGRWLVSPKAILTQAHNTIMTQGIREKWPEPYGSRTFYERVKFGLNAEGTEMRSSELFRSLGLLPRGGSRPAPPPTPVENLVQPWHLAGIVLRNLVRLYVETIKYGLVVPTFLMIFAAMGVTSRPWRRGADRRGQVMLVWWLLAGGSWVFTYVQPRFLYPSLIFVIPWMAEGWRRLEVWALESFGPVGGVRHGRTLAHGWTAVLAFIVGAGSLVHVVPPTRQISRAWVEHEEAGLQLKASGAPKGIIMALTPVVSFYAHMPFVMLPYAEINEILPYARRRHARYLVADMEEFPSYRPQLIALVEPELPHPGLRPVVDIDKNPDKRLIVYEILPEGSGGSKPAPGSPGAAGSGEPPPARNDPPAADAD